MTDGEALIRSILAAPADDAPRLVYADWLDEHGRAEDAEFIRVQIELARLGLDGAFHVDAHGQLQRMPAHIERLQERQLELWMGGAGRPDIPPRLAEWPMTVHPMRGPSLRLRRGFVERVASFADVFVEIAAGLFRRQPITDVALVDREPISTDRGYVWSLQVGRNTFGSLRRALWPFLSPGEGATTVAFPTADAADAALSWASVRYGRRRAGLPER